MQDCRVARKSVDNLLRWLLGQCMRQMGEEYSQQNEVVYMRRFHSLIFPQDR